MKNIEEMLMQKKDKSSMSKEEIQAKMEVLQELMDMCKDKMGQSVKSGMDEMNKVTVAAPDKESLAMGLDKAKMIAEDPKMLEMMEDKAESPEHEASETPSEEKVEESSPMSYMDDEDEDSIFAKRK